MTIKELIKLLENEWFKRQSWIIINDCNVELELKLKDLFFND